MSPGSSVCESGQGTQNFLSSQYRFSHAGRLLFLCLILLFFPSLCHCFLKSALFWKDSFHKRRDPHITICSYLWHTNQALTKIILPWIGRTFFRKGLRITCWSDFSVHLDKNPNHIFTRLFCSGPKVCKGWKQSSVGTHHFHPIKATWNTQRKWESGETWFHGGLKEGSHRRSHNLKSLCYIDLRWQAIWKQNMN